MVRRGAVEYNGSGQVESRDADCSGRSTWTIRARAVGSVCARIATNVGYISVSYTGCIVGCGQDEMTGDVDALSGSQTGSG